MKRFRLQAYDSMRQQITVPWEHAEQAYKAYSSSQTLERIDERGGFGVGEMITLLIKRIEQMERDRLP